MALLEIVPQAFDSYTPPSGINIMWYWDFAGKQPNQVIGFFMGVEIATDERQICEHGDIIKEIENNRCFNLVRIIPPNEWATVIPNFNVRGDLTSMPVQHPNNKPEWAGKKVATYTGEIDEAAFEEMNEHSKKQGKGSIQVMDAQVKKHKNKGAKDTTKITMEFVTYEDTIVPENDV